MIEAQTTTTAASQACFQSDAHSRATLRAPRASSRASSLRPAARPLTLRTTATWPVVPQPPATESELLEQIVAGSEAALEKLYDNTSALVLGLLHRMLGASGEAEEVLQEVFLQVWRQAGRYRPELASPRGWLMMMARSRALDRLKAGSASRRREESVMGEAVLAENPLGSRRLEEVERAREVRRALAELPAEQRQAVELAFFVGLSHSQIAARLGAPLGTVKSRVLLGMRKLKSTLTVN